MTKEVTAASWAGKAAHEIIQLTGRTGASAHATARSLVNELLDHDIDLAGIDARNHARQHLGLAPAALPQRPQAAISGRGRSNRAVHKDRKPSSTASWIGMAAHEIDRITLFGTSTAAELAHGIARLIERQGYFLLDTDPRANARLHFGPEAMAEKKREQEKRQERILQRKNRQTAFLSRATARGRIAA